MQVGVIGSLPAVPPAFARERLLGVRMTTVVAPGHPLANYAGPVPPPPSYSSTSSWC